MSNCKNYKLTIPDNWSAEQAWAIVELVAILNESIWDIYEEKLLDHARHKPPPQCDNNGRPRPLSSYKNDDPF